MHEASFAESAFDLIREIISKDQNLTGKKVLKLIFSQNYPCFVNADSFNFYFSELVKGSLLEGAEVVFKDSDLEGFILHTIDFEDK